MDIRSLRYFVRVVDFGSFTRAAANLHIAQPALTRHIQRLEDEFGLTLLERASRGVTMTEAGDLLYRRGTELLRDADRLRDELLDHSGQPAGRVVVGITATACAIFARPLLQRIRAQFPRITVNISEGFSKVLGSWLVNGDIDIAVVSDSDISPGLRALNVVQEELLFLARPGRANTGWISPEELATTPLILSDGIHKRVEAILSTPLTIDMKLNSVELIRHLVQDGVGVSILPYSAARDEILSGTLQAFRIGETGISRQLALCTSETRRVSTATRVVVDTLASISGELMEEGYFTYVGQPL
ncbi:MAG: LysR family transcriptional regulator, nitrogen assimilation regulatory protein [Alphaproteobacteria bacterium]|nr:LysR family transcriptional regulator, nitrogen assimilation regulatory protein [Alphaproteobacteria bacterium]